MPFFIAFYCVNQLIARFYAFLFSLSMPFIIAVCKRLGKTLRILNYDDLDRDKGFKGKVYLWDYNNKEYVDVFISGQPRELDAEEVSNYLSSGNVMKIKFQVSEGNGGCTLPVISAMVTK